ncbi:uncharacterized protein [Haliotis cracherodii]|uniref:uncharacterized protein n=1 Tax=Haliotis cracherodii TaxID=6455 RepID=UPI0039E75C98
MASCFNFRINVSKRTAPNENDCTPKPVDKHKSLTSKSASSLLLEVGKASPRYGTWVSNNTYGTSKRGRSKSKLPSSPTFWMMKAGTSTKTKSGHHKSPGHHKSTRTQLKAAVSDRRDLDGTKVVSNNKERLNGHSTQCIPGSVPRRDSDEEECIKGLSAQYISSSESQSSVSEDSLDAQKDLNQSPTDMSSWSNMNSDIYITAVQRTLPRCCPPKAIYVKTDIQKDVKIITKPESLNHTLEPSFANIVNSPVITLSMDSPPDPGLREAPPARSTHQENVDLNQHYHTALPIRDSCLHSPGTVNDMCPDIAPRSPGHRGGMVRNLSRRFQKGSRDRSSKRISRAAMDTPSLPPRQKDLPVLGTPPRPCSTPCYANFKGTLQSRKHLE